MMDHSPLPTPPDSQAPHPPAASFTGIPELPWTMPWLAPYAQPTGHAVQQALASGASVAQALACVSKELSGKAGEPGRFPTFVPQADLPKGQHYERFIRQQWAVPTREHLHDVFNGLIWLHWPQTKRQLNALQSAEIDRLGVQGRRGKVRDACTVFDENGAVFLAPAALHEALLARDWIALFWSHRALWSSARLLIVGHALLEQLCQPRKSICAHVLTLHLPEGHRAVQDGVDLTDLDRKLARLLSADAMASKPLTPMPVLGIPAWSDANDERSFYEDTAVFRPPRP